MHISQGHLALPAIADEVRPDQERNTVKFDVKFGVPEATTHEQPQLDRLLTLAASP